MFIESVRARATCNTIISSHLVSSHRPCTVGPTPPSRLHPFPLIFPALSSSFPPIPFRIAIPSPVPHLVLSFFLSLLVRVSSFILSVFPDFILCFLHIPASFYRFLPSLGALLRHSQRGCSSAILRHLPSAPYPASSRRPFNPISSAAGYPGTLRSFVPSGSRLHSFYARRKRNRAELWSITCAVPRFLSFIILASSDNVISQVQ